MLDVAQLEKIVGYKITKPNLYVQAFTHASYGNEQQVDNYEKLEFIGDSLLNFFVAMYLFEHVQKPVGFLSKLRSSLVSTENLVEVAKQLHLDQYVLFSKSMQNNHTRHKVYADIVESLLACIYIDKGIKEAQKFVHTYIIENEQNVQNHAMHCMDYKTLLQEKLQSLYTNPQIMYVCNETKGTSDQPQFSMELWVDQVRQTSAWGTSKKQAEQECARLALEKYNSEGRIEL